MRLLKQVRPGYRWIPVIRRSPENDARRCASVAVNHHRDQLPRFADVPDLTNLCYNAPLHRRAVRRCNFHNRITRLIYLYLWLHRQAERGNGRADGYVNRLLWMQNHYPLTGEDVVAKKRRAVLMSRCGSFSGRLSRGKTGDG